jgi:hypothetical protein
MAASWAMRRDGSFIVELFTPLKYQGREVDHLVIAAPRYEHTARWNKGDIPSALALLAELTNLPERLLRQAVYPDMDRITVALFAQAKFLQADVVIEGKRPFATPDEELPDLAESGGLADQVDSRFPHVDGPIKRFAAPPKTEIPPHLRPANQQPQPDQPAPQPDDNLDLGLSAPDSARAMSR